MYKNNNSYIQARALIDVIVHWILHMLVQLFCAQDSGNSKAPPFPPNPSPILPPSPPVTPAASQACIFNATIPAGGSCWNNAISPYGGLWQFAGIKSRPIKSQPSLMFIHDEACQNYLSENTVLNWVMFLCCSIGLVSLDKLNSLNPGLDCSALKPGQILCVASGISTCTETYQVCQSLFTAPSNNYDSDGKNAESPLNVSNIPLHGSWFVSWGCVGKHVHFNCQKQWTRQRCVTWGP